VLLGVIEIPGLRVSFGVPQRGVDGDARSQGAQASVIEPCEMYKSLIKSLNRVTQRSRGARDSECHADDLSSGRSPRIPKAEQGPFSGAIIASLHPSSCHRTRFDSWSTCAHQAPFIASLTPSRLGNFARVYVFSLRTTPGMRTHFQVHLPLPHTAPGIHARGRQSHSCRSDDYSTLYEGRNGPAVLECSASIDDLS